jgi:aldehyde dehydrogenase (NAD+)
MAASRQVKPVIMELGGKSPQIVLGDADLNLAANGIATGIFPPAGQTCIAGSRLLVQRELHDKLVDIVCNIVRPARLGHPENADTQIGPIANEPHFRRILEHIKEAKDEGARLVLGGNAVQPDSAPNGWFIEPTIFTDVTPDMRLAREEVFGPVLAVVPFDSEEDAIRIANDSKFGLAAGVWTRDSARGIRMAERIAAGTVYINNYFNATTQSPVGGYKQSGYGRENGIEGMKAFLQTKSVWLATEPNQPNPFA